jgi:hypothetical protein
MFFSDESLEKVRSVAAAQSGDMKILSEIRAFPYSLQAAVVCRLARTPYVGDTAIHF